MDRDSQMAGQGDGWRVHIVFGLVLVLYAVVYAVSSGTVLPGDPDLWWHIRTGEWIWQNRALPVTDSFSHSFAGHAWIAKEWLSQLIFAAGYGLAGWNGVAVMALIAVALAAAAVYRAAAAELSPLYALALSALALTMAFPSFVVRPHLLSLPLAVIWAHQLFAASWKGRAPHFAWLLVLVLWANLHAAFTIGFVIAGCAFIEFLQKTRAEDRRGLAKWLLFLGLCLLASLIHPYGWQPLLASWMAVFPADQALAINEWQAFNAQIFSLHEGLLLLMLLAALATGFRLSFGRALLLVMLLHLMLVHVRFLFYFFPLLPVLLAAELARQVPQLSLAAWQSRPRDGLEQKLSSGFKPIAAALSVVILGSAALQLFAIPAEPEEGAYPKAAIAFAQSKKLSGNVFNYYDFGGPLIFLGIRSFIDGRTDQLFRDHGFSLTFAHGPTDPRELSEALDQYKIGWTLLKPDDKRNPVLARLPGWSRAYADKYAVIYQRSGALPP